MKLAEWKDIGYQYIKKRNKQGRTHSSLKIMRSKQGRTGLGGWGLNLRQSACKEETVVLHPNGCLFWA